MVVKAKDYVVSSCSDMKSLLKNKSFVLSTIAFTCVTYCAGAMMWWGPNFAFAGAPAFKPFAPGLVYVGTGTPSCPLGACRRLWGSAQQVYSESCFLSFFSIMPASGNKTYIFFCLLFSICSDLPLDGTLIVPCL